MQHAEALGCVDELLHTRTIIKRGSSASRQLDTYTHETKEGASKEDALKAVVDHLIEETLVGI